MSEIKRAQEDQDADELTRLGFTLGACLSGPGCLPAAHEELKYYQRHGFETRLQAVERGVNIWKRRKTVGDAA